MCNCDNCDCANGGSFGGSSTLPLRAPKSNGVVLEAETPSPNTEPEQVEDSVGEQE